jgi:hypothetical protein
VSCSSAPLYRNVTGAGLSVAWALLVTATGFRAHAQASPGPVELTWSAPAECPPREAVLSEIARVLGPSPEPRAPAIARAQVTRDDPQAQWHATLVVDARNAQTERAFEAESCEAIVSATALIVAVAVDGRLPEAVPPPPRAAGSARRPERALSPPPPQGSSYPAQLDWTVGGMIDSGTLPHAAAGGELVLGWSQRWAQWRFRLLANGELFGAQRAVDRLGNGAYLGLLTGSARGCASALVGPVELGPCLGAEIDYMWAESGVGSSDFTFQRGGEAWPTVLGSLLGSFRLSQRVGVFARVDGVVRPVRPPQLAVRAGASPSGDPVYQPPGGVGYRAAIGLEMRFF